MSLAIDAGSFATKDFIEITRWSDRLQNQSRLEDTLVVFDIDNTLLKLSTDLGSEQWFLWQSELIKDNVNGLPLVTDTVEHLLQIQAWIYDQNSMALVDVNERVWIDRLREQGAAVISLTSRSIGAHDATSREIERNNIKLSSEKELGLYSNSHFFLPYQLDQITESGLTETDAKDFNLAEAKYVSFDKGLYMTQGQNKGIMLKTLLHRMKRKFKTIIFIDDRITHIKSMKKMAQSISENVYSIHFNKSDNWTIPFYIGDKSEVQSQWCQFSQGLNQLTLEKTEKLIIRKCNSK